MTCGHALKHYGIPLRESPGILHVAIPAQRSRVPNAIGRTVVHRVRGLLIPKDTEPPVAVSVNGIGEVDLVLSRNPEAIVPGPANGTHILTPAASPALLVETDGYAYHSSPSDWHRDHLRDQAALAQGHIPIRLTSNQVLDRDTVRIISPVTHHLGIHPDVTLGDF